MVKRILVIVHQETSDPGLVGQLLRESGYTLDLRCPAIGHSLPTTMEGYAGAIVLGGPMSANDDDTLPFIRTELDWIPIALESGKPYLGICLGAQLLARVLGGRIDPHPEDIREIGYVPIQPTRCEHNPLANLTHVYHWHKEGFTLPQEAVLLATGAVFPHQAFRYGKSAYGVQFHPEITRDMIDIWIERAGDQIDFPGAQPHAEQTKAHDRHAATVKNWLDEFLPYWLSSDQASIPDGRLSA
ncbi:glutamine amidotransferase [filamentous cyanobacterium CCP1]|nr:glutamine amidotransferase [filamentous cyanobacterium CCP2]PSB56907.1 glutamine amidotransferase [filamentous cyanobacterium CCP1]